jgi:hypothetical protein
MEDDALAPEFGLSIPYSRLEAAQRLMPLSVATRSISPMPVPTSTRSRPDGGRCARGRPPAGSISLECVSQSPDAHIARVSCRKSAGAATERG